MEIFQKWTAFLLLFFVELLNAEQLYPTIKELQSSSIGAESSEIFVKVDLGISESIPNTRIAFYIDINNDKFVDIIGITKTGNHERPIFFEYDPTAGKFKSREILGIQYENAIIENIIANDFNKDEKLDLMITYTNKDTNKTNTQILLFDKTTSIYKKAYEFSNMHSGIIVADLTETIGLDFLFYDEESHTRKLVYFNENSMPIIEEFKILISNDNSICDRSILHLGYPLRTPHSSAFVDIDGDCLNDLLIMSYSNEKNEATNNTETKYYLEIWRGMIEDKSLKYCLTQSSVYPMSEQLGLFSLADIDRDSLLDLVFPIINSKPPQIMIAYNKIQLSYDWTEDYCSTHYRYTQQSSKKTEIPLLFEELRIDSKGSKYLTTISLTHSLKQTFYSDTHVPIYLRFGDINQDSYPDFVVILYDTSDYTQNTYVFLNSLTDNKDDTTRTFSLGHVYYNPNINNAVYSSFFDFEENGKLDLIIVKQETSNVFNTECYLNTQVYDAFYLKSLVLNQKSAFFGNEAGTSFRFITTNIDGGRRMDLATQATQVSTTLSLNLPYAYIGIGRSNNYIENFHVISGNYIKTSENHKIFTPIIPNSQIIIRHFLNDDTQVYNKTKLNDIQDTKNTTDSNKTISANSNIAPVDLVAWQLDLIVKPTSKLSLLIVMIILILSFLLVAILYLHFQETKEDNIENQENFAQWFDRG